MGSWSTCAADCSDITFTIQTAAAGGGDECETTDGATASCADGDGDCAEGCVASPCALHGDGAALCLASGESYSCSCSTGWESSVDHAGSVSCAQTALLVKDAIALAGAVSPDDFTAGIISTLAAASRDTPAPTVIIESYNVVATSKMTLPGMAEQFGEGSTKLAALSYGLQLAACGDVGIEVCSVVIYSVGSQRRLLQSEGRRRLQAVDIAYTVEATIDLSDTLVPDVFSAAFVNAVVDQPGGALSDVSVDDLSVEAASFTTTIAYSVLVSDVTLVDDTTTILADDSAVASGISSATPGTTITVAPDQTPSPSPTPSAAANLPAPVSSEDDSSWWWVVVVVAALVVGGAGGVYYYYYYFYVRQQSTAESTNDKREDSNTFKNPLDESDEESGED